jgi:hypothetical protein
VDDERFDDPDHPLDDWENPDPDDEDEVEDEAETRDCPMCGMEIYEDAVRCPLCGEYVGRASTSPLAGRPMWFVLLGLLGIGAVIFVLLTYFGSPQ